MLFFGLDVVFALGVGVKPEAGVLLDLLDGSRDGFTEFLSVGVDVTEVLGVTVDLGDAVGVDLLESVGLVDFVGDPFPLIPGLFAEPMP